MLGEQLREIWREQHPATAPAERLPPAAELVGRPDDREMVGRDVVHAAPLADDRHVAQRRGLAGHERRRPAQERPRRALVDARRLVRVDRTHHDLATERLVEPALARAVERDGRLDRAAQRRGHEHLASMRPVRHPHAGHPVQLARPAAGGVEDDRRLDPSLVRDHGADAARVAVDGRHGRVWMDRHTPTGEVVEVGPHDRVVMDDRVVAQHGAGDRLAALEHRQVAERLVRRQQCARDAEPRVHRDDVAHPLDLVGLVQDPGVAEPVEQHVRAELAAHPLVLVLARHRDPAQVLGQLHAPDPRDVAAGGAGARVAALDDHDPPGATGRQFPGGPEPADARADDHDVGRTGKGHGSSPATRSPRRTGRSGGRAVGRSVVGTPAAAIAQANA